MKVYRAENLRGFSESDQHAAASFTSQVLHRYVREIGKEGGRQNAPAASSNTVPAGTAGWVEWAATSDAVEDERQVPGGGWVERFGKPAIDELVDLNGTVPHI